MIFCYLEMLDRAILSSLASFLIWQNIWLYQTPFDTAPQAGALSLSPWPLGFHWSQLISFFLFSSPRWSSCPSTGLLKRRRTTRWSWCLLLLSWGWSCLLFKGHNRRLRLNADAMRKCSELSYCCLAWLSLLKMAVDQGFL